MGLVDDLNEGAAEAFYGGGETGGEDKQLGPEEELTTRDPGLAFSQDDVLTRPFIDQLNRLAALSEFIRGNWDALQVYLENGIEDDAVVYDIENVTMQEALLLSLGLNLVGFFVPDMGEAADAFSRRLLEAAGKKDLDEATHERIKEINRELGERKLAEMLGFNSVEEFREATQDPEQLISFEGEEPYGDVIAMVPKDED